jgi:hypothetical protein
VAPPRPRGEAARLPPPPLPPLASKTFSKGKIFIRFTFFLYAFHTIFPGIIVGEINKELLW